MYIIFQTLVLLNYFKKVLFKHGVLREMKIHCISKSDLSLKH